MKLEIENSTSSLWINPVSCDRHTGRWPKQTKKDRLAEFHYIYTAAASTLIQQFLK